MMPEAYRAAGAGRGAPVAPASDGDRGPAERSPPDLTNPPDIIAREVSAMKRTLALATVLLASGLGLRASGPSITGDYVEVRTAEVYTGGCILGSEGETGGREAILAWRVSHGALNGVSLDGLSVVAVVAGDRNLGTHELGGAAPTVVKSVVMVDERAQPAQQQALLAMAKGLAPELVTDVVELKPVAIEFKKDNESFTVSAGAASLDVALLGLPRS